MDGSSYNKMGNVIKGLIWLALFSIVAFMTLMIYVFWLLVSESLESTDIKSQAISRGFALYCPSNGEFAWIDECSE